MKIVYFLPLFFLSIASADSDQLSLRGVVREELHVEISQERVEVRSNSQRKDIPFKISRSPSSIAGFEQLEVVVP